MYRGWRVVLCVQCWHKPFVALCTIKTGDKKFFMFNAEGHTPQEAAELATKRIDGQYKHLATT